MLRSPCNVFHQDTIAQRLAPPTQDTASVEMLPTTALIKNVAPVSLPKPSGLVTVIVQVQKPISEPVTPTNLTGDVHGDSVSGHLPTAPNCPIDASGNLSRGDTLRWPGGGCGCGLHDTLMPG